MSEETKNPLIESFLKLHEDVQIKKYVGGVGGSSRPQSTLPDQILKPAYAGPKDIPTAPSNLVGQGASKPLNEPAQSTGSQQFSFKTTPPRPAMDTAPKPQVSISRDRPEIIDNSASLNKARTEYQTRVARVERQNPISAPGKLEGGNLQMGSRGDSVKELQRKLGVKDDGVFGKDTAAALKAFQQKNNLKVDAIYGRQSASAMNRQSSMDALKKENPVGAALSKQSTTPIRRHSPMPISGNQGMFRSFLGSTKNQTPLNVAASSSTTLTQNDKPITADDPSPMGLLSRFAGNEAVRRIKAQNQTKSEETEMPNKLIEAFMKLQSTNSSDLFAEAKKAKKLDPVGKEDEDIDNDGDKDKTDSYLHNRRKKIAAAMKEAIDPKVRPPVKKDPYGGDETSPSSMGIDKPDYAPAGTTPDYAKPKLKPSVVKQTGKNSSEVYKQQAEEVEQIEEAKKSMLHPGLGSGTIHSGVELHNAGDYTKDKTKVWVVNHKKPSDAKSVHAQNPHLTPDEAKRVSSHISSVAHPFGSWSSHGNTVVQGGLPRTMSHWTRRVADGLVNKHHTDSLKEEVEFSEAELAHIAAIFEANPVAPTPDDYSPKAFGPTASRSGTLTDEAIAEEEAKRGRGRPKGSKSGSKHGGGAGEGVETKHIAAQIKFANQSGASDGKGNFMLKHPKTGQTKAVSAKAATEFYTKYHGMSKPADKEAHTNAFLEKHFGSSEKPKTSGITLPKMPAPKS